MKLFYCSVVTLLLLLFAVSSEAVTIPGGLYVSPVPTPGVPAPSPTIMPIQAMQVRAEIVDFLAKVTLTQTYFNGGALLTASYQFPLDEQSSVTSFTATIGDNTVIGKIEEKAKAQQMYDNAVANNQSAFLLTSKDSDVFVLSIGNLPPQTQAVIVITYLTKLQMDEGLFFFRFYLPSATIAQRYNPQVPTTTSSSQTPATDLDDPLYAKIEIKMPFTIQAITSPSHTITAYAPPAQLNQMTPYKLTTTITENTASVIFRTLSMDKDFVIVINQPMPDAPRMWVETQENQPSVAMLAYTSVPGEASEKSVKTEVIFIVDTSGSMSNGNKMELTKTALMTFIDALGTDQWINFVRFSSDYTTLYPSARQATNDVKNEARSFVQKFGPNGGTELANALSFTLGSARPPVAAELTSRKVIMLTDGEVSDTGAIVNMAAANRQGAIIFTLGVGGGASHELVSGLARVGQGIAEYVMDGEQVTPAVMRQAARAMGGDVHDNVRVSWQTDPAGGSFLAGQIQTPSVLPAVFPSSTAVCFKFLQEGESTCNAGQVSLTASGGWNMSIPCEKVMLTTGDTLRKLAVRSRIRELEETTSLNETVKAEIISLSKSYNILSSLTSFIAIMENNNTLADKPSDTKPQYPSAGSSSSRGGYSGDGHKGASMCVWTTVLLLLVSASLL